MPFDFDKMVDEIADVIADRAFEKINARVQAGIRNGAAKTDGRRTSKLAGRMLEMACRYPGCKNRSKGPRFRFMCEEHRKLPKAKQLAALEKWKSAHASA